VAVGKALHGTLLGSRACAHMAAAAWATGVLRALLLPDKTFSLSLGQGNALGRFCGIPHTLELSGLGEFGFLVHRKFLAPGCFVPVVVSSVRISRAVLRIPCEQGRHEALSTCLPHPAVVSPLTGTFSHRKTPLLF
ncbi:O14J1 protein, partial [Neopipo cinnamomea]|nr:O14J1 protein [Neopipo cinnamomea]